MPDFEITCAESAFAAFQKLTEESFHVIISDYHMPGMNGVEFFKELRRTCDFIHFILISGQDNLELEEQALRAGIDHFLPKSLSSTDFFLDLAATVHQLVPSKHTPNMQKKVLPTLNT